MFEYERKKEASPPTTTTPVAIAMTVTTSSSVPSQQSSHRVVLETDSSQSGGGGGGSTGIGTGTGSTADTVGITEGGYHHVLETSGGVIPGSAQRTAASDVLEKARNRFDKFWGKGNNGREN